MRIAELFSAESRELVQARIFGRRGVTASVTVVETAARTLAVAIVSLVVIGWNSPNSIKSANLHAKWKSSDMPTEPGAVRSALVAKT
jgi:hypothetical protein